MLHWLGQLTALQASLVLECIAPQSSKTPTYTVIVWAGSVFLQYLPPKRSCCLGQHGYVYILYCNFVWMSNWGTALAYDMVRQRYTKKKTLRGSVTPVCSSV